MNISLNKFGGTSLVNYINLTEDEKLIVLEMRNHPEVRCWMYSQQEISKQEHYQFIESLKSDVTKRYFMVKQYEKVIGAINFTQIDNQIHTAEFGFFRNPNVSTKGLGKYLLELSTEYAFTKLKLEKMKLEVFDDNQRAKKLYKRCGFKLIKMKHINGRDVLCMEKSR